MFNLNYFQTMSIHDCIDLERYPLDKTDSIAYWNLVAASKQQLDQHGCCLLPDFVRPIAIERARKEAVGHAEVGYQMNHYFSYDDVNDATLDRNLENFPEKHPLRFRSLTKIRFVARDLIDSTNPVQRIHA